MIFQKHFVKIALLLSYFALTSAVEIGSGYDSGSGQSSNGNLFSSAENVVMSVGILCAIVFVALGCTWTAWRRILCFWRNHGTHEAPPHWFEPGSAYNMNTTDGPSSTTIVNAYPATLSRNGHRSSITVEPLPNLSELGVDGRDSFELKTYRPPAIVSPAASISDQLDISDWIQLQDQGFPRQSLEYQKLVGKGWFGKVLESEAIHIKPHVRVSNVIVRELRTNASEEEQQQFLVEVRMFREAYNQQKQGYGPENILKLVGFCIDQLPYILIFEYYPLGDLKSYLKQRSKQAPSGLKAGDDGVLTRMIIDIVRGLKWMIQSGFVHGDLAARNCLVATSAGKVIIGDYGYSTQKFRADYFWTSNCAVPIRWAAPETLSVGKDSPPTTVQTLEITHESNIWSLGVVIWEIYQLGKLPYENLTDEEVIRRVIVQGYVLEPPQLPFVNVNTKDKIYQLLASCWNSTPNLRPTIDAIEHVFTTPSTSH